MMRMNKAAAAALAAMMLVGCGNGTAESSVGSAQVKTSVMAAEVLAEIDNDKLDGIVCIGNEDFDNNAEKFYGAGLDEIEDGGILYNAEDGCADEISLVRFKAGTDGSALLQKRLEERTATFRNYRPEELPKLEKARIIAVGGYDMLIISDDGDALAKQIEDRLS